MGVVRVGWLVVGRQLKASFQFTTPSFTSSTRSLLYIVQIMSLVQWPRAVSNNDNKHQSHRIAAHKPIQSVAHGCCFFRFFADISLIRSHCQPSGKNEQIIIYYITGRRVGNQDDGAGGQRCRVKIPILLDLPAAASERLFRDG